MRFVPLARADPVGPGPETRRLASDAHLRPHAPLEGGSERGRHVAAAAADRDGTVERPRAHPPGPPRPERGRARGHRSSQRRARDDDRDLPCPAVHRGGVSPHAAGTGARRRARGMRPHRLPVDGSGWARHRHRGGVLGHVERVERGGAQRDRTRSRPGVPRIVLAHGGGLHGLARRRLRPASARQGAGGCDRVAHPRRDDGRMPGHGRGAGRRHEERAGPATKTAGTSSSTPSTRRWRRTPT